MPKRVRTVTCTVLSRAGGASRSAEGLLLPGAATGVLGGPVLLGLRAALLRDRGEGLLLLGAGRARAGSAFSPVQGRFRADFGVWFT